VTREVLMNSGIRRFLVVCPACKRQFDATEIPAGARFRCYCGELVAVPRLRAKDAAVVRCIACGASRGAGSAACGHCGADFTVHERDMHTICPECLARISDRARFCHHCGTAIRPQAEAGQPTEHACPACGEPARLRHREMGTPPVALLECTRCGGLWLGTGVLEQLAERARRLAAEEPGPSPGPLEPLPRQSGPLYRRCPICGVLMSRVNHGRRSGVIVDRCPAHGVWFDERELEAALRWIRGGGETRAARTEREEERAAVARERFRVQVRSPRDESTAEPATSPLFDLLGSLLD
jgi:Zn-finger nucleic acid-binding protein